MSHHEPTSARLALLDSILEAEERAFFALAPDGAILFENSAAQRLGARLTEGRPYTHLSQLIPASSEARMLDQLAFVMAGNQVRGRETLLRYERLGAVHLKLDYKPLRDASSAPFAVGLWVRDISTQRAERGLTTQLLDALPDEDVPGVVIIGPDHTICGVNEGYLAMTGHTQEELLGASCSKLVHDPQSPRMVAMRRAMDAGEDTQAVIESYRADRSIFVDHLHISHIQLDQPRDTIAVAVHRDDTEHIRLRSQDKLKTGLLHAAQGALIVCDAQLQIVSSYGEVQELTGWTHEELVGRPVTQLLEDGRAQQHLPHLLQGKRWSDLVALRTRSGEVAAVTLFARPVPGALSAPDHFAFSFRDRRVEHELETQLVQAKSLEHLGWMIQGIVHDLNHSLTLATLHLDELAELLMPAQADAHHTVEGARAVLLEAANLARSVLQLARSDAAAPASLIELDRWLPQLTRLYQRTFPRHIALTLLASPRLVARTSPGQLQQVLFNLLHNAVLAMPPKHPAPHIKLLVEPDSAPSAIRFTIEDNGCGMDQATLARIFEPHFTTRDQGTGLGIPLCKLLIERWGGQISFHSAPDQGTSVCFTVPAA